MEKVIYEFTAVPQMERYYNDDSNYGVYTFITSDDIPEYYSCKIDPFDDSSETVRGSTLAGKMQKLTIGMEYVVKATMEYNAKYKSYNYVPTIITANVPKTPEQQINFLKTQVTPLQAKNILAVYPNVIEDVMQNKEIDYTKIKGVGEITWNNIKEKILGNYVISDILSMLQPIGVTFSVIRKLIAAEPNPSLLKEKLLDNPYIITRIHGIGFKKADDLALKLNPNLRASQKRVIAFIKYFLNSVGEDLGHTWVTQNELDNAVRDNIYECYELYEKFITSERQNVSPIFLCFDGDKVGMVSRKNQEMSVLQIIEELEIYKFDFKIDIPKGIKQAENEQGFEYTDEQKTYIKKACESNVVLISGLAGTGKTTILRALLKIYQNYSIGCCALSAKAAQRITEATGHKASTIHRLLKFNKIGFGYNKQNRLLYDVVLLDEASMVNIPIFYALVSAVKEGAKIIICGDDGQLPPIGYGNIFHDLLELKRFTVCKLTKILRQAEKSGIISDSIKIRHNENPLKYPQLKVVTGELQDMTYMFRENREGMRELAINLYLKAAEQDGIDETIIITPCKKDRVNSSEEINKIILDKLIPNTVDSIKYGIKEFRVGAKVIQRANDYEKNVFNGEIGYVTKIWEQDKTKMITIDFGGKIIDFTQGDLGNLELAYALTVHVTQGSGYKNVIVIIDNTHYKLLDSCLLYTALTRAKKKCLLIAESSAYKKCIDHKASERQTWLRLLKKNN